MLKLKTFIKSHKAIIRFFLNIILSVLLFKLTIGWFSHYVFFPEHIAWVESLSRDSFQHLCFTSYGLVGLTFLFMLSRVLCELSEFIVKNIFKKEK